MKTVIYEPIVMYHKDCHMTKVWLMQHNDFMTWRRLFFYIAYVIHYYKFSAIQNKISVWYSHSELRTVSSHQCDVTRATSQPFTTEVILAGDPLLAKVARVLNCYHLYIICLSTDGCLNTLTLLCIPFQP